MFAKILKPRFLAPLAIVGMLMTSAYAFTLSGSFIGAPEIASEARANFVAVNISNTHLSEDLVNDSDAITDYHFCVVVPVTTPATVVTASMIEVDLSTATTDYSPTNILPDPTAGTNCFVANFAANSNLTIASIVAEEVSVHS